MIMGRNLGTMPFGDFYHYPEYVSPAEPNITDTTGTTEVLWKLSSFGFRLLSPNDQQNQIEEIPGVLSAAGVADVKRLEGETEEDLRSKKIS
ncbi:hypothetical protein ACE6H2_007340 [Prunus campanulata]